MLTLWPFITLAQPWLSFLFRSQLRRTKTYSSFSLLSRQIGLVLFAQSWQQINNWVKRSRASDWCSPCLQSAASASAKQDLSSGTATVCHRVTLDRRLSCNLHFSMNRVGVFFHYETQTCLLPQTFILSSVDGLHNPKARRIGKHKEACLHFVCTQFPSEQCLSFCVCSRKSLGFQRP